jgi:hypothetical protein
MRRSTRLVGAGLVVALLAPGSWQTAGAAERDDLAARRGGLAAAKRRSIEPAGQDPAAQLAALQRRETWVRAGMRTPSRSRRRLRRRRVPGRRRGGRPTCRCHGPPAGWSSATGAASGLAPAARWRRWPAPPGGRR